MMVSLSLSLSFEHYVSFFPCVHFVFLFLNSNYEQRIRCARDSKRISEINRKYKKEVSWSIPILSRSILRENKHLFENELNMEIYMQSSSKLTSVALKNGVNEIRLSNWWTETQELEFHWLVIGIDAKTRDKVEIKIKTKFAWIILNNQCGKEVKPFSHFTFCWIWKAICDASSKLWINLLLR